MSEGQNPTATLTISREPASQDVELLHEIVLRAQNQPLATDRDSLITAYDATFKERGLDSRQDDVCFWLLIEMLKPEVEGKTLYEKFESVMRHKGIEVIFDDDGSVQASPMRKVDIAKRQQATLSRLLVNTSSRSSQDIADLATEANEIQYSAVVDLDQFINNPPPHIAQLERMAIARDTKTLVRASLEQCFDYLQSRNSRAMEQAANRIYERRLSFKVMSHWQALQRQAQLEYHRADSFYTRPRTSWAFNTLLDSARINRIQAMDEVRLRGMGLYKLTLATRESTLRHKLDMRLKRKYVTTLMGCCRATSAQYDRLANQWQHLRAQSNARLMRRAVGQVTSIYRQRDTLHTFAREHYALKIKQQAVVKWYEKTGQMVDMKTAAENAREFFLMRKYFLRMREVAQARKQRRTVLGRWCLTRWREFTQRQKHQRFDSLYKAARRKFKMDLARRCLSKMGDQASNIEQMQQVADRHHLAKSNLHAHTIVVAWYTRSHQLQRLEEVAADYTKQSTLRHAIQHLARGKQRAGQLTQIADQFHELHVQRVSLQCLRTTRRKTFEILRRQQDADALQVRYKRQGARSCLEQWHRKAVESRGEGPLILPPATPAQRRADQLHRIASTTPMLAPPTSFTARLRGEVRSVGEVEEDDEDDEH